MDVREKLVELLGRVQQMGVIYRENQMDERYPTIEQIRNTEVATRLIANGVTVQEHGYLETVVEVKDNTVCGNGVKIEYKRCSCCKNQVKFLEDDFCGHCGAKLDLTQPPKGE